MIDEGSIKKKEIIQKAIDREFELNPLAILNSADLMNNDTEVWLSVTTPEGIKCASVWSVEMLKE